MGKPVALEASAEERRDPGVHLDDDLLAGGGVHGELHVRPPRLHPDPAHAGEGGVAHLLVLDVGQRLRRGHRDRVAGVHAHGVDVLDGADDHAVVGPVPHDLELELLPAGDRPLDEDLGDGAGLEARRRRCGAARSAVWAMPVPRPPRMKAGRTTTGRPTSSATARASSRVWAVPEGGTSRPISTMACLERLAVLGGGDGVGLGPDQLHPVAVEHPGPGQLHGQVERRLAAQGGQQGVGPLPLDDPLQHLGVEGLDVGGVGQLGVGHDRGRVRVGQDHPVALGPQHPAGLGAGVVELAGLADDDGARADDQDRAAGRRRRGISRPPPARAHRARPRHASGPSARRSARTGSGDRGGRDRPRGGTGPRSTSGRRPRVRPRCRR